MAGSYPYTPFPFSVTPISPLFHAHPSSLNASVGWAPNCTTSECLPIASWSTSAVNSTLSLRYWGWDVAFDGHIKGNMTVELFRDGIKEPWYPSENTLFRIHGGFNDDFSQHEVILKVVGASPNAEIAVTQARVNGSSFADLYRPADRWIIAADSDRMNYTGFAPRNTITGTESSISSKTYISSKIGDTVSTQFNGSTFLVYGPCGPTNGLMRVTFDNYQETVNTSTPFVSDDCLLYHTRAAPVRFIHQVVIENVDGSTLGINRLEFFRILIDKTSPGIQAPLVVGVVMGVIAVCALIIVLYVRRVVKKKEESDGRPANRRLTALFC
ncbi:unnamed protein product [Rhizoctonia solani]|uniref:Uncharacterized protein n=1 Tax=Rhizoctonia solani TaxID=456999 RepID=A0A8H3H9C3_9AGAM|nr:unnamed protein product [Rhizoctonia solani]